MTRLIIICLITIAAIVIIFIHPPIAQDTSYHLFADHNQIFTIDNFWNVISNLGFLIVGSLGLIITRKIPSQSQLTKTKFLYMFFFIGVFLTGLGSAYYHLQPNNITLVWDRIPMTIIFISFFSLVLCNYISLSFGKYTFPPFLIIGISSVLYWYITELEGAGDLRLYVLVQFLPIVLMPFLLLKNNSTYLKQKYIWFTVLFYLLGKIPEILDKQIFEYLHIIGGHPIKHILAASATFMIVISLKKDI
ncbi:MAG: ceramidase domain-containing protein [Spirochaetota bacterium]|nr:ceramidase domain-containing protein [Spirochaetota bacterium]